MDEFCEECFLAKDRVCPVCHEALICSTCEETCLSCYLWPPERDGELDADADPYVDLGGEGGHG